MSVRRQQKQQKWLLNLAVAGVVAGAMGVAAQHALAVAVPVDPLNFEPQHRSDTGVYLESRAQVTASGMRNGFQSNFGNRNGGGTFPDAGIESVYYFKLPSLAAGETVASASMWFSGLHESASSGVQPKGWNVDLYAMGFEKSEAPHTAPIDVGSTGVQSNYAQSLFYVGPSQTGTWTPASGPASPIVKIQDNLLTPDLWIPFSAGATANSQRQTSAQAELDLGGYIQSNLYNNASFTADHDLFTVRMNPDVNTYTGTSAEVNQRYQTAAQQTSSASYPGLVTPTLNLVVQSQWNQDNSTSSWSSPGSWSGSVPNATDRAANFGSFITAAQAVSVDAPQTVAMLKFDNTNSYTLNGSQITLEGLAAPTPPPTAPDPLPSWYKTIVSTANVIVAQGSHTVNAPVALNSPTNFNVAAAPSTLTIASLTANGKAVGKAGAGALSVGTGFTSSSVNVSDGTLKIASDASANHVVNAASVSIGATGKLDLADNKLITNTIAGTATAGVYNGVQGDVQRANNFGAWDQPGLTTSMPDAVAGLTTIGVATGEQVRGLGPTDTDTFAGQTITGASTIAMYTYAGDANLDGTIDGGDYGIIDNFAQIPGAAGYANGDFNYDGVIDGGDYGIIDNNNQAQGAPFPTSSSVGVAAVTAVPEPTAAAAALLTASLSCTLRRRRQPRA